MKNRGLRTFLALAAGLAVIYFGNQGSAAAEDGRPISSGVLALAIFAGIVVWYLTKPGSSTSG